MKFLFRIIPLLFFVSAFSQEEVVHSVYFETAKFNITSEQGEEIVGFAKSSDSSRIESISIYGYCDDRGKDEYNFKLSSNRANTVKEQLLEAGIKSKIIVTIEGRGRVLIEDDIDNVSEIRSKNRRVDVVINFKEVPFEEINLPGIRNKIVSNHVIGDRVYLEKILFERGSSKLTLSSKKELDYIARQLLKYRNLHFEIQGHVCCTPKFHKEAIDKDTKKRKLSHNRAEAVYKYLIFKRVDKKRMTFKGYGNSQPLGEGADLDRRVELVITKV